MGKFKSRIGSNVFYIANLICCFLARFTDKKILIYRANRLGHQARDIDYFARRNSDYREYIYLASAASNEFLEEFYRRELSIYSVPRLYKYLHKFCELYPTNPLVRALQGHLDGFASPKEIIFRLSDADKKRGYDLLEENGIARGARWVCFHARDPAYLKSQFPDRDFDYHGFRDCDVKNYVPALEWLAEQGIYSLRMGAVTENPLPVTNDKIRDYANEFRSDFMDVFLASECFFFFGPGSGPINLAQVFTNRVVFVNAAPFESLSWSPEGLTLPKIYRDKSSGQYIPFGKMVEKGAHTWGSSKLFDQAGIEVLENSPTEILEAIKEVYGRLTGSWQPSPQQKLLLQAYHANWPAQSSRSLARPFPLVAEHFLSSHQEIVMGQTTEHRSSEEQSS